MNKTVRGICVAAAVLVGTGFIILVMSFAMGGRPAQIWSGKLWGFSREGFVTIGAPPSSYRNWDNAYSADGSYEASAKGIRGLDIRWIAGSAEIVVGNGSEIVFTESAGNEKIPAEAALRYGTKDGILYIQYCPQRTTVLTAFPAKKLVVQIPESLASSLETLTFDGSSAELRADGITASRLVLDGVSGDMTVSGNFSEINADSASGSLDIKNIGAAQSAELNTVSGDIRVSGEYGLLKLQTTSGEIVSTGDVTSDSLRADSVSGSVELVGSFSELRADTTSGSVEIASGVCPAKLEIDSVSGEVSLGLPADSGFTLEFDSVSGDLQCDFSVVMKGDTYICGDGSAAFRINTTSGEVGLHPLH